MSDEEQTRPKPEVKIIPLPEVNFGTDVVMRVLPEVNGRKTTSRAGDEAARQEKFNYFQSRWNLAGNHYPALGDFNGDVQKFKEAEATYVNNPLRPLHKRLEEEYNGSIARGESKENADAIFKSKLQDEANGFMKGVDQGPQQKGGLMASIMADPMQVITNPMGLLWQAATSINFLGIGDMMGAAGKAVMNYFETGKWDFGAAKSEVIAEKSYAGGAEALGLKEGGVLVSDGINFARSGGVVIAADKPVKTVEQALAEAKRQEQQPQPATPTPTITPPPGMIVPPQTTLPATGGPTVGGAERTA